MVLINVPTKADMWLITKLSEPVKGSKHILINTKDPVENRWRMFN